LFAERDRQMKISVSLLLSASIAVASAAVAAPLQRADVPANPAWVAHLDCDALRSTYAGRYLLYQMNKPEMNSNMLAFQAVFSFDIRTQLHGITVYSDAPRPKDTVVIIYAELDRPNLVALLQKGKSPQTMTNNHHVIYSWIDPKKGPEGEDTRSYASFPDGRMVVGKSRESTLASLAVIDGAAPNLTSGKSWPELTAATPTTFLVAAARNLDFVDANASTALLKLSKSLKFRASEDDEQLHAALTLDAGDELTARQMSLVTQGFVAMLGLQKENPKTTKLTDAINVQQHGSILTATLSTPSADVIAALKAAMEKKANKKVATQ
jgi:hypothetical protein